MIFLGKNIMGSLFGVEDDDNEGTKGDACRRVVGWWVVVVGL